MATPTSVQGHPVHPMLIPFPIGLWIFSFVCDVIYGLGWGGAVWNTTAFYTMAGGLIGALVAAVPGYLDFRSLTAPDVVRIARWHMIINLATVVVFAIDLWMRWIGVPTMGVPFVLSVVGIAMLGVSGWLGGELVYVRGVAVETQMLSGEGRGRGRAAG